MPTNYTPLTNGQFATATTFNAPLTELDDAIEAMLAGTRPFTAIEIDGALNHDGLTVGFHGATPTVQYATTGTSAGFTAGGGTTATHLSTFTGNIGSTAYTVGDIVRCLKLNGLMAT